MKAFLSLQDFIQVSRSRNLNDSPKAERIVDGLEAIGPAKLPEYKPVSFTSSNLLFALSQSIGMVGLCGFIGNAITTTVVVDEAIFWGLMKRQVTKSIPLIATVGQLPMAGVVVASITVPLANQFFSITEQTLKEVEQHEADVELNIEKFRTQKALLPELERRIEKIADFIQHLTQRLTETLEKIHSNGFDYTLYQEARFLAEAIADTIRLALLDENGDFNSLLDVIAIQYKDL